MIKIPVVPQWNLTSGCVCTPDGGLLYAGSRSINFISFIEKDNDTVMKCFHTRQGILSIDIDPQWGQKEGWNGGLMLDENVNNAVGVEYKEPPRLFVALLQDNSVQIWDFNKGCAIQGHTAHLAYVRYMEGNGPSPKNAGEVFISYMCNRNVLSIDKQDVVVYCVASNTFYRWPVFISSRHHVMTSLKCSPYNENQFAIGTKRGLVLLCDLQKMSILYTLRGHDTSISSFAWNRVDLTDNASILAGDMPEFGKQTTIQKQQPNPVKLKRSDVTIDSEEIFDIYNYEYLDNEFGVPNQEMKLKNDFVSDLKGIEIPKESYTAPTFDFAEACLSLGDEINALKEEKILASAEHVISLDEFIDATSTTCSEDGVDADKKNKNDKSEKESSDSSLVQLACRTPSSESFDIDGTWRKNLPNFICQADVHYMDQLQDNERSQQSETLQNDLSEVDIKEVYLTESSILEKENQERQYDILLVSCSIDGGFCVWNAVTGATCDTQLARSIHGAKKTSYHIEVAWISSISIIINNRAGDLQLWSMQPLSSNQTRMQCGISTYKFKQMKHEFSQHSVVSLACSPKNHLLWSITFNRKICLEDFVLKKIQLSYNCVSTNIGAMLECPDDMNKIALGFCDRRIGIIDISKITPTSVYIENFTQRIESNVLSLAWSPDCKKLAYGTGEGRIGVLNVESSNKQPLTYNSISGKPIYSMCWQDKFLYLVCKEQIAVYEDDPNKKDPYIISEIKSVACISLRDKYLFVGTQNGQLRWYIRTGQTYFQYEPKGSIGLAPRYISYISWSPIATNKMAVVANANSIHILEFNSETAALQIIRKIEIDSTSAANSHVKWSNRNENYFLTCGFEGAVRVWDLSNEKNPEHFVKTYNCPMTCGLFLPTDEEIILCSGKSAALETIDMRLGKSLSNSGKTKRSNPKKLDNVQWASKAVTHNDAKSQALSKKLNRRLAKASENNIADFLESKTITDVKTETVVAGTAEASEMLENLQLRKADISFSNQSVYMKNPLTLLYLTTKEINKDALDLMHYMLSSPKSGEHNKSLSANLFGTKTQAKQLLAEEMKNHQGSEIKGVSSLFMTQLNGSLKDEILKCVQTKQLCEWHVSLAPTISYSFWQKCCQAFAEQLVERGFALQAAAYMLAIHKQQEAIEILMEKKLFKEAALIARIYLQPEDHLNNTITEQWITHLNANGNLTGAALLSLLSKQNNRAFEFLAKIRNTSPEIERVIRLLKSNDKHF